MARSTAMPFPNPASTPTLTRCHGPTFTATRTQTSFGPTRRTTLPAGNIELASQQGTPIVPRGRVHQERRPNACDLARVAAIRHHRDRLVVGGVVEPSRDDGCRKPGGIEGRFVFHVVAETVFRDHLHHEIGALGSSQSLNEFRERLGVPNTTTRSGTTTARRLPFSKKAPCRTQKYMSLRPLKTAHKASSSACNGGL